MREFWEIFYRMTICMVLFAMLVCFLFSIAAGYVG